MIQAIRKPEHWTIPFNGDREKVIAHIKEDGADVEYVVNHYNLQLSDIMVVCDDLNLPLGKIRLRKKGSHGGQKGLASIIDTLGTQEFPRLRMGIGFNEVTESSEYVLSPFRRAEKAVAGEMIIRAAKAATDFMTMGIERTMNIYNATAYSYIEQ